MLRSCTFCFLKVIPKVSKKLTGCSLRTKNSMTAISQVLRHSAFKALTFSQWTSFYGNNADKLVDSFELSYVWWNLYKLVFYQVLVLLSQEGKKGISPPCPFYPSWQFILYNQSLHFNLKRSSRKCDQNFR